MAIVTSKEQAMQPTPPNPSDKERPFLPWLETRGHPGPALVIAYLDCYSGISGDMFLGALLDLNAGFSLDSLKTALAALPLQGYQLKLEPFQDKGIRGSRFDVALPETDRKSTRLNSIHQI